MGRITLNCQLIFVLLLLLDLCCQVISEYCGDDKYCQPPTKCCANKDACCYDYDNSSYTRGFKLHVWNMWYFWLVIIFILMSCFGGCGYYRRRRLAALQQSLSLPTEPRQSPRRVCMARARRQPPQPAFYAYTGPGVHSNPDVQQLPPPYMEVMQQPDLYPVNKVELPPYPGPPADKDCAGPTEEVSPPPYYEVAPQHVPADSRPQPSDPNSRDVSVPMECLSDGDQGHSAGSPGHTSTPAAEASS